MSDPRRDDPMFSRCWVCGRENPAGLHVTFHRDGADGCRAEYTAQDDHAGWPGIVHGGLLFTLMDEALAWALTFAGRHGVTGRAEVRYREPLAVGTRVVVTGKLLGPPRRVVKARAELRRADDQALVAELDGTMMLTDVTKWQA